MGLTGVSATTAVGSPSLVIDVTASLTGQSATITLGTLGIQHFQDVDTGSNTSYSNVATGSQYNVYRCRYGSSLGDLKICLQHTQV